MLKPILLSCLLVMICIGEVVAKVDGAQQIAMNTGAPTASRWQQWVNELRHEALSQGIRPDVFDSAFAAVREPDRKTINLDRRQPEKRLTFLKYRKTRSDAYRIKIGRKKFYSYQDLLNTVNQQYGVDACVVTAIWGLESAYGHYMGKFSVIKSLATLAYDRRRSAFFRKELLLALQILNDGHIDNAQFVGEWAGGTGMPQFLPSSWHKFAVDFDGDGRKDIWKNHGDVFASISNYLLQNGWRSGEPWGYEVKLPHSFDRSLVGKDKKRSVADWQRLGVKFKNPHDVDPSLMAEIIEPHGGPDFMAFNNFRVFMRYNNSTFYAGTVGYLADQICHRKG